MGGWAKAGNQARTVIKALQQIGELQSVRTAGNYQAALENVAQWLKDEYAAGRQAGDLKSLTPEKAIEYLEQRGQAVGQSQLNMERQAIQLMQQSLTHQLSDKLPVIKSELTQTLNSRAYTPEQAAAVADRQQTGNALATQIAHSAGLRAHELLTLRPATERPADERPTRDEKFAVREGERYTVTGKGGLIREVLIPRELADRLEAARLAEPQRITDRGVYYQQHYAISGGQRWSNSFSQASNAALGWSQGAHGLRHSYAQERMGELQRDGLSYRDALEVVSQEMGHFRLEITEVYLR
jgi:integrase